MALRKSISFFVKMKQNGRWPNHVARPLTNRLKYAAWWNAWKVLKCSINKKLSPSSTSYFLNPRCQEVVLSCHVLLPGYSGSGRGSMPMSSVHLTSMMATYVSAVPRHCQGRMMSDFTSVKKSSTALTFCLVPTPPHVLPQHSVFILNPYCL